MTNKQSEGDSCLCCWWSLAAIDKIEIISCERCESETLVSHAVIIICVSSFLVKSCITRFLLLPTSQPLNIRHSVTHVKLCAAGFLKEHARAHLLRLEMSWCVSLGY